MDAHVGPHAGHRVMGRVITAAIAAAVLSGAGGAQTVRLGVVMDEPREQLEREWTEQPRQVERAYCVIGWWAVVHRAASGGWCRCSRARGNLGRCINRRYSRTRSRGR